MLTAPNPSLDLTALLPRAARIVADKPASALTLLLSLAAETLGAPEIALFRRGADEALTLLAGPVTPRLCRQAAAGLVADALNDGGGDRLVLAALDAVEGDRRAVAEALAPFFAIALRQDTWRREVDAAQAQAERRIREVATVPA